MTQGKHFTSVQYSNKKDLDLSLVIHPLTQYYIKVMMILNFKKMWKFNQFLRLFPLDLYRLG